MSAEVCILLTGHLPWSEEKQTPHYVADALSQAARVIYVEPPVAWHPDTPGFDCRRCVRVFASGVCQIRKNLWTYTPAALPLGRLPFVQSINHKLFCSGLRKAVRQLLFFEPILWLAETDNSRRILHLYPNAPSLFQVIDYISGNQQAKAAAELVRRTDLILASSPLIASTIGAAHCLVFRNGWEFPTADSTDDGIPPELAAIKAPLIGLVGYINKNLDYDMLYQLAEDVPASLVIIGRRIGALGCDEPKARKLLAHRRVHFLGERPTASLARYIRYFDVCVAPYKKTPRIYASDPLKIYQYLACGRPVVATPVEVLEQLSPLVRIADTYTDFIAGVKQELTDCNDPTMSERRRAFAESTRWPNRWRKLATLLSGHARLYPLADVCRNVSSLEFTPTL